MEFLSSQRCTTEAWVTYVCRPGNNNPKFRKSFFADIEVIIVYIEVIVIYIEVFIFEHLTYTITKMSNARSGFRKSRENKENHLFVRFLKTETHLSIPSSDLSMTASESKPISYQ